jgi:formate hydrogenlyase transcriptional activator
MQTIRSDVRIVAATNRPLEDLVAAGQFRADLYYRLNVFPIDLPPLRERREDIPALVRHFVARHAQALGRRIADIPVDVMDTLVRHPWPGNVRELQHVIQRAVIMSSGSSLRLPRLAVPVRTARPAATAQTFEDAAREHILSVLRETHGVIAGPRGAAARLGLKRTTLHSKMERLGIAPEDVEGMRAQRFAGQSMPAMQL